MTYCKIYSLVECLLGFRLETLSKKYAYLSLIPNPKTSIWISDMHQTTQEGLSVGCDVLVWAQRPVMQSLRFKPLVCLYYQIACHSLHALASLRPTSSTSFSSKDYPHYGGSGSSRLLRSWHTGRSKKKQNTINPQAQCTTRDDADNRVISMIDDASHRCITPARYRLGLRLRGFFFSYHSECKCPLLYSKRS